MIMSNWLHIHMPIWEALLRLVMAVGCGGVIGWERQRRGRSAGLRTHMMIALGAAGFTLIAMELAAAMPAGQSDPSHLIQGIVGGIGFLGAGAILHRSGEVEGLTTAAGIWAVAAIGTAAGAGQYAVAVMMTALGMVILSAIRWLEPEKSETKP